MSPATCDRSFSFPRLVLVILDANFLQFFQPSGTCKTFVKVKFQVGITWGPKKSNMAHQFWKASPANRMRHLRPIVAPIRPALMRHFGAFFHLPPCRRCVQQLSTSSQSSSSEMPSMSPLAFNVLPWSIEKRVRVEMNPRSNLFIQFVQIDFARLQPWGRCRTTFDSWILKEKNAITKCFLPPPLIIATPVHNEFGVAILIFCFCLANIFDFAPLPTTWQCYCS